MSFSAPLRRVWHENQLYLLLCLGFILLSGLMLFWIDKGDAILWFSARRSAALDAYFTTASRLGEGFAFVTLLVFLLFVRVRYALGIPILGLSVTVVAWLAKTFFAHPRPLAYFRALGEEGSLVLVEGIDVHQGLTSFPSGHTMAGFALYTFAALCVSKKNGVSVAFFLLAASVGISRIYLVQHFLQDVHFGAILGLLIGMLTFMLLDRREASSKWDQSLSSLVKS